MLKRASLINYKDNLLGDLGRLRQVVTNLLTNATKFTMQGYVTLEVTEIESDNNDEKILIRFDIRDSGCGIHPDVLSRLFQPFSQADASTARRYGGTGLGLSISKNLVELMEGKIGLDSIEGQGSHAWFIIPFRKANETLVNNQSSVIRMDTLGTIRGPEHNNNTSSTAIMLTHSERPRKDIWILIAEDNALNARIASRNVEKLGFNCKVAKDGNVALTELYRRHYDLVLMDCMMPDCDGYEATRLIRKSQHEYIRCIPVIALTASAIKGDRDRALTAGMVDYLAKPSQEICFGEYSLQVVV